MSTDDKPVNILSALDKENLNFKYFPDYAKFLLENRFEDFVREQLSLSRELKIPMLRFFESMSEEALFEFAKQGARNLLNSFVSNSVLDYINSSLDNWINNQIPLLDRDEINIEDIVLISFVRRKIFRDFVPAYTSDVTMYLHIMEEVDRFTVALDAPSFKTLNNIQNARINRINAALTQSESDYKLLNIDLQEREDYLQQLIKNAPDAIIVIDTDSKIILWNPKTTAIFGWTEEEVIGKHLADIIIPVQYRDAHIKGMQRLLSTGEERVLNKSIEITGLIKQGIEIYISLTISRSIQAGKTVFIAFIRDISKEKKTQIELERNQDELDKVNHFLSLRNTELQRANKELESFNYIASHDLQEPLRKIQTYSNRILEKDYDKLPNSTKEFLNKIYSASERMQLLIQDFLDFSQAATTAPPPEPTDINIILQDAKTELANAIEEENAVIESSPLPVIHVIPFQFKQLMVNLISNAVKYHRKGIPPYLKITYDRIIGKDIDSKSAISDIRYHRFTFADNGIGFENEYADKIFEIFQRLHGKLDYSGTGIGLAICKKIAENHKGFIKANGRVGEGAVFEVYIP